MTDQQEDIRTLELKKLDGEIFYIGIPKDARVTFGRIQPSGGNYAREHGHCLRVYKTEKNQLAIFTGLQEFRDTEITVVEKNEIDKEEGNEQDVVQGIEYNYLPPIQGPRFHNGGVVGNRLLINNNDANIFANPNVRVDNENNDDVQPF